MNNYCIAVQEKGDNIVFLRKIIKGSADKSYGIAVARLAGVPEEVIRRAEEIAGQLEQSDIALKAKQIGRKESEEEPEQLSLFESMGVMPVEINRYDHSGQLVEENTGAMQMRTFKNGDDGMTASVMLEPDRGIAHVSISLNGEAALDLTNVAGYLCCDCLAELASQLHGSVNGVGVVSFSTQRLYVLQESVTSFGAGDYYIHCDRDAERGEIDILITYSPLRFDNET